LRTRGGKSYRRLYNTFFSGMAMLVFLEGLQGLLGLFKHFLAVCLRGLTPMGLAYGLPVATRKKKKRKKVFSTLFQRNKRKRKNKYLNK